jgi:hypothetical protein
MMQQTKTQLASQSTVAAAAQGKTQPAVIAL